MKNDRENGKKHIHLIGIGGISMSAIAKKLIADGYIVSGSDIRRGDETDELIRLGAKIFPSHSAVNVEGADAVIFNSAIKSDNAELIAAREKGMSVYSRMDFLSRMAKDFSLKVGIAGCHGKTTTTAMLANILKANGKKFLSHIGGEDDGLGNLYYSGNDIFLSEVCEYDRNIEKFPSDYACLLNIDFDHVDCYDDISDLKRTYFDFLDRAERAFVNADDPLCKERCTGDKIKFGINSGDCDVKAEKITVNFGRPSFTLKLPVGTVGINSAAVGEHNVYNMLGAAAVAYSLGIDSLGIKRGLEAYTGVKRRFEMMGRIGGASLICDYAHHPREIAASVSAAKKICGNDLIVYFQPHTYSRTKALMEDFVEVLNGIGNLSIVREYAAREQFLEEGSAFALYKRLKNGVNYFASAEETREHAIKKARNGNVLLFLGAGDIYDMAREIVKTYR